MSTANVVAVPWMRSSRSAALRLKIFRQQEGLTIPQLAEATGVDAAALRRYERAERPIPEDVLVRLALFFECTVAAITE